MADAFLTEGGLHDLSAALNRVKHWKYRFQIRGQKWYQIKCFFLNLTDRDIDFFEQCLNICMVQKEKFLPFLSYIEDLIMDEIFQFFDLNGFYDFIMTKAVEMKQVEHVQLLLDYFVCPDKKGYILWVWHYVLFR